jgi:hypothetical protein
MRLSALVTALALLSASEAHSLSPPVKKPPPLQECENVPTGGPALPSGKYNAPGKVRVCSDTTEPDWSYIEPRAWDQAWRYIQMASNEARSGKSLTFRVKCGRYSGDHCLRDSRAFLIDPTRHPVWQARYEPCREPAKGRRCIAVRFGNQCVGESLDIATRANRAAQLEWIEAGFYACPQDPAPPPPIPIPAS